MLRMSVKVKGITAWCKNAILAHAQASRPRYKIVDFCEKRFCVSLQSNATRACFTKKLITVVMDAGMISELPPEQACFLGLMTARYLKTDNRACPPTLRSSTLETKNQQAVIIDRHDNVIFLHPKTKERCVMQVEYIIAHAALIDLFSPLTAYSLGLRAGFKLSLLNRSQKNKPSHLRLVS
jgi:hypothetical protein